MTGLIIMSPIPDLPADVVSAILACARERGIRTAHDVGNADRGLIEGLVEIVGKEGVSIMDMLDRWKTGFAFWWEERDFPNTPCPERPEWLEGVSCYQEGGPNLPDLLIRDIRWNHRLQLHRIIAHYGRREGHIPGIIMIGEAREASLPSNYEIVSSPDHITLIRRI
jgi:hypothetical protein